MMIGIRVCSQAKPSRPTSSVVQIARPVSLASRPSQLTSVVANGASVNFQLSRGAAKQKLTPAQKSLREKQQHAKLVEEVMNKLDEDEYSYVNQGQRDGIKNHTNLTIVLHMVIDDNKEFRKRLDTWLAWNPGTPGVFAPKKTAAEKAAEKEKKDEELAAEEVKESAPSTPKPASKPATKPREEEEDGDEPILPDEGEGKKSGGSGKFELRSFLKQAGVPAKSVDTVAQKLKDAGFTVDVLPEVNDAWLKKAGLGQPERQQVLKQTFTYLSENPVD